MHLASSVRVAAAGLGAAVAGPLGGAIGGWVAESFAELIKPYVEKFAEKAGEELFKTAADSFSEKLKEPTLPLEGVYREALRASLIEVHAQLRFSGLDTTWFTNWETALSALKPLNLLPIAPDQVTPESLDTIFVQSMEGLDAQGVHVRKDIRSLDLKTRVLPRALRSELTSRLPPRLQENFKKLIVKEENNSAFKELNLLLTRHTLRRLEQLAESAETQYTHISKKVEQVVAIVEDVRIKVGGLVPQPLQPPSQAPSPAVSDHPAKGDIDLELNDYEGQPEGFGRFHYRTRAVKCFGREHEISALERFLQDERRFLWFALIGPAGSGKSRLAFEFGIRNKFAWDAGFARSLHADDLLNWVPRRPTLILIDDFDEARLPSTKECIERLQSRCNEDSLPFRVRILLLKRDANGPWLDKLLNPRGDGSAFPVRQALYKDLDGNATTYSSDYESCRKANFLELGPLDRRALHSILDDVLEKKVPGTSYGADERSLWIDQLTELDPLKRPLFAAMLANLPAADRQQSGSATGIQTMIEDYISHERERWQCEGRDISDEDEALLALATLSGGLDLTDESAPDNRKALARYSRMCGKPVDQVLSPLEPDIVGEIFVLNHFSELPKRAIKARDQAWLSNRVGMSEFLSRAAHDFPTHPTLRHLGQYSKVLSLSDCLYWLKAGVELVPAWHANGLLNQAEDMLSAMRCFVCGSWNGNFSFR